MTTPASSLRPYTKLVEAYLNGKSVKTLRGAGPKLPAGEVPYAVVRVYGLNLDGPVGAPQSDANPQLLVHSVGEDTNQAEAFGDRVRSELLACTAATLPPPPGRAWLSRGCPIDHDLTQPTQDDDDYTPPLFYVVDVFSLRTVPA